MRSSWVGMASTTGSAGMELAGLVDGLVKPSQPVLVVAVITVTALAAAALSPRSSVHGRGRSDTRGTYPIFSDGKQNGARRTSGLSRGLSDYSRRLCAGISSCASFGLPSGIRCPLLHVYGPLLCC